MARVRRAVVQRVITKKGSWVGILMDGVGVGRGLGDLGKRRMRLGCISRIRL